MSKLRNTILIIALAAATPWLQAAEPRGCTLDELITEALARNPELKFYEAEIDAARGQRRQAGTQDDALISRSELERLTSLDFTGTVPAKTTATTAKAH